MESARPQTAGEEELQLQLALAMSREEAEQEEQRRRSDDVRLQLALSQSQQDFRWGLDILISLSYMHFDKANYIAEQLPKEKFYVFARNFNVRRLK